MKKRAKIGDILEIKTQLGRAYAQYSHYHAPPPNWGALLRVLPGIFSERPKDLKDLIFFKEAFSVFFPIQGAINRGLIELVAHAAIPVHAQKFPMFRTGFRNPATGKVEKWSLWDGTKQWRIDKLANEQFDLPIKRIWSYPTLVEHIEMGWTPRRNEEFTARARAAQAKSGKLPGGPRTVKGMRHYLVLKDRESAVKGVELIGKLGLQAGMTDLDNCWGVNVLQPDLDTGKIEEVAAALEKIAKDIGGSYDGSQVQFA